MIELEIVPNHKISSMTYGNNFFKLKVADFDEWIEKLINCVLIVKSVWLK